MLLLPGDRFIVRQFSPVVTIGGGVVLDASPTTRKQRAEDAIAFLKIMRDGSPEQYWQRAWHAEERWACAWMKSPEK
jgi:selenocysteine-specific elongation factor